MGDFFLSGDRERERDGADFFVLVVSVVASSSFARSRSAFLMRINYCPENLCILRSEFVSPSSALSCFLFRVLRSVLLRRIFRQIKDVNEEAAIFLCKFWLHYYEKS